MIRDVHPRASMSVPSTDTRDVFESGFVSQRLMRAGSGLTAPGFRRRGDEVGVPSCRAVGSNATLRRRVRGCGWLRAGGSPRPVSAGARRSQVCAPAVTEAAPHPRVPVSVQRMAALEFVEFGGGRFGKFNFALSQIQKLNFFPLMKPPIHY